MAKKERDRRPVGHRPPPCAMAPGANFRPGWVICSHSLRGSCVLAGCGCARGAGPLAGTTTGLTAQLLVFMELFHRLRFLYCLESSSIQDVIFVWESSKY